MAILSAKNIYKKYGTVEVLKGVDIEVEKGEIVSIVGPSGSGKSTLLHILGTLDKADSGILEINNVRIEAESNINFKTSSWSKRLLNFSIDSLIIGMLSYFLSYVIFGKHTFWEEGYVQFTWQYSLFNIFLINVYYLFFEGLYGKTLAKFITRTKVIVILQASKPNLKTCFIRTICRFIPFEIFSFFSLQPKGLHDTLSDTVVVDDTFSYLNSKRGVLAPKELSLFRNKHIGFIFQFHHLLPEFTALENVCIPGWLAGGKKSDVQKRAEELLIILGLRDRLENKPNALSGGEQQRVAVARALINNPDVVFADEPTGNLDSANAKDLHQLFFDLRNQFNQTFLIVTHNEELAQQSDRMLVMKDGKMV